MYVIKINVIMLLSHYGKNICCKQLEKPVFS